MTTKSPTSTCGAYCGLCLPRSSCAVWLASRPSTTSVASMTCQARVMSPGLGEYVRTALVSSVVVGKAGGFASPSTGDGAARAAPAGSRANRARYQPRAGIFPADGRGAGRDATGPSPVHLRSVVRPVVGHRRQRVDLALAVPGRVTAVALALLGGAAVLAGHRGVVRRRGQGLRAGLRVRGLAE